MVINRRILSIGLSGFIAGLAIGLLLASVDIVPFDLGGGSVKVDRFYLVELETAIEWLQETYTDDLADDPTFAFAVDDTLELPPWREVWAVFPDAESSIQMVLAQMHQSLIDAGDEEDKMVLTCLGLDDDPYRGEEPGMYLYVQVPYKLRNTVTVPDEWETLDGPKESIFWILLSCYPDAE
jgi:hypothetical protein